MNCASQILNHLSQGTHAGHVLLVAGAPPVEKLDDKVKLVLNDVLTPEDIRDTLQTFLSHVRRDSATKLGEAGIFSFGMPQKGRFRVHYLTQRGSLAVSILRMPFVIPPLDQTLADPSQISLVHKLVDQAGGGIVLISGSDQTMLAGVAYALLSHINETRSTVICACEQNLSYTLRHHNSVVVQIEFGTDSASLGEALGNLEFLHPGVLYVSNCKSRSEYTALIDAAEAGTLVLASMAAHSEKDLADNIKSRLFEDEVLLQHQLRGTMYVTMDESRKLRFTIHEKS